jgi:hypothetical protein
MRTKQIATEDVDDPMTVQDEIDGYIAGQPETKRGDMVSLHGFIRRVMPDGKLWFLDGRNSEGKIVSNPNIGYGSYEKQYASGQTMEFYQIGLSANTGGISVYVMGIDDRKYLPETYGERIGKASVSGYCVKFKKLADIDMHQLETAMRHGIRVTTAR